jgi:hypothetical protein
MDGGAVAVGRCMPHAALDQFIVLAKAHGKLSDWSTEAVCPIRHEGQVLTALDVDDDLLRDNESPLRALVVVFPRAKAHNLFKGWVLFFVVYHGKSKCQPSSSMEGISLSVRQV